MRLLVSMIVAALFVGARPAAADTVVLKDGARLSGDVSLQGDGVTIRSGGGILTLPRWRVERVEGEESAPSGPARDIPGDRHGAPAAEDPLPARTTARSVPLVPEVLEQRIGIDFSGAPVSEILSYIQGVTDVNMLVGPAVEADQSPVHIHAHDMSVRLVLEHVLPPHGFAYAVRPGNVLYIDERAAAAEYVFRAYPVRDLLRDMSDVRLQTGGGSDFRSGGDTGEDPTSDRSYYRLPITTAQRTESLMLLLGNCCGRSAWRRLTSPDKRIGGSSRLSDRVPRPAR